MAGANTAHEREAALAHTRLNDGWMPPTAHEREAALAHVDREKMAAPTAPLATNAPPPSPSEHKPPEARTCKQPPPPTSETRPWCARPSEPRENGSTHGAACDEPRDSSTHGAAGDEPEIEWQHPRRRRRRVERNRNCPRRSTPTRRTRRGQHGWSDQRRLPKALIEKRVFSPSGEFWPKPARTKCNDSSVRLTAVPTYEY